MTIVAPHKTDAEHLAKVIETMRAKGAPTIRVIDVGGGVYAAIEGCHRLAAAKVLDLEPAIEVVDGNDDDTVTGLDLDDRKTWTIGELREYLAPQDLAGAIYELDA
jgi:hypothetical protein